MQKVSIIVRCYNEEAHIGRLLSGIVQQSGVDLEIIIVDSGSTDATVSIASQYTTNILNIKKEDFSFGYSLNVGCEAASGEILILASAHVYPLYHDWASRLIKPFTNDQVACSYGRQCGNDVTKYSERRVFAHWFPNIPASNQTHPFCNNANAAIRRSVWQKFRYDEALTGLEDIAWAKRVMSAGFRVAYVADAEVVHVHEETWRQVFNRYRREAIALKTIFPHEKFTFLNFLHMLTKNSIEDARCALDQGVFRRSAQSILAFRLMQFWGTYRGYAQHGAVSKALRQKFYYPNNERSLVNSTKLDSSKSLIDYSSSDKGKINE